MDWILLIGAAAIAVGPAVRWFVKNKPSPTDANNYALDNAGTVIGWTLIALLIAMFLNLQKSAELETACSSFRDKIGSARLSDDQNSQVLEGKWFSTCYPEMSR